jgi:hypothetical protein
MRTQNTNVKDAKVFHLGRGAPNTPGSAGGHLLASYQLVELVCEGFRNKYYKPV